MEPIDPQIPERFEIREELYRSEQNVRLRAFDKDLEQEVVLEYSGAGARQLAPSASERRTALRQARMRAKVKHDKIQPLKEIVETPQTIVHVLEPRAGETLEHVLRERGTLSPDETIELGVALAEALQALHAEGVVHRAVAADNILMLGPEMSALTGFAFAKPIEGLGQSSLQYNPKHKETSAAKALPHHPAPEQVAGQAADARSDIFAVGCVLYRCLTARPAFADHSAAWVEPRHPCQIAPDIPKPLAAVILKCLRQSPMGRTPTMLELREELLAARPSTAGGPRRTVSVGIMAAATVLVGTAVWLLASVFGNDNQTAQRANPVGTAGTTQDSGYEPRYNKSYALLIGLDYKNNTAGHIPLDTPGRDVRGLDEDLKALGFETIVLDDSNGNGKRIRDTLYDLKNRLVRDDQLFIYFAGHGVLHANSTPKNPSGYILPADADECPPDTGAAKNWVHTNEFLTVFDECKAKHILLALDCCHAGTTAVVAAKTRSVGSATQTYQETFLRREAKVLMVSCTVDQKAADNSPFAKAFRQKLQEVRGSGHPATHTAIQAHIQSLCAGGHYSQMPSMHNVNGTDANFVFLPPK